LTGPSPLSTLPKAGGAHVVPIIERFIRVPNGKGNEALYQLEHGPMSSRSPDPGVGPTLAPISGATPRGSNLIAVFNQAAWRAWFWADTTIGAREH
jgi:hypothetical protein